MSVTNSQENITIACDWSALSDERREQHMADAVKLFTEVHEVRELADGYALGLPDEVGMLSLIADFINDERLCCPFIHFNMEVEPYQAGIWLKLGGSDAIKQFIVSEIGHHLTDAVATTAGLR